ncbi:hypothetical protein AGMMS50276_14290 [Synergistales bacterium]|nr:hypothetical protein AGMMS50276_14290 [Synergistales bacterium]
MTEQVLDAIVYSCIAFSIVFVVLGGLTLVIFAMRLFTGSDQGSAPKDEVGSGKSASTPAAQATPPSSPSAAVATGGQNSRVVAAITAAISAATQGRGTILSIAPQAAGATGGFSWDTTQVWRGSGIVASVSRRLSPSWKK